MVLIGLAKKAYRAYEDQQASTKDNARRRYSMPPSSDAYNYQPYHSPSFPQFSDSRYSRNNNNTNAPPPPTYDQQVAEWDEDAVEYNENGKKVIPGTPYTKTSIKEMLTGGDPREMATVIAVGVILTVVILMFIFEHKIVHWLEPVTNKLTGNNWGWLVPVAVMVVLSIPPLFGHEIVLILVGVVWGLWPGWGIAAFGTVIGEIVTWFFVRVCFMRKSYSLKESNLRFATMSRMCVEGGFLIIFILRLSFIPAHFTTAVFAVSGVSFWVYFAIALLTTPKLLVHVLIGQNFDHSSKISRIFLIVMILITILATLFVKRQMAGVKTVLIEEARAKTLAERKGKQPTTRTEQV